MRQAPGTRIFLLPQLLIIPKSPRPAGYCHKSLIRNVSPLTKHWSSPSAHRIQRRYVAKASCSLFSPCAAPHHPKIAPPARISQQKPGPQFCSFSFSCGRSRLYARYNPHYLLSARPTRGRSPVDPYFSQAYPVLAHRNSQTLADITLLFLPRWAHCNYARIDPTTLS